MARPSPETRHLATFSLLWAVAHVAHVLRKEYVFHPAVWILLLASVLLIERPSSRTRLGILALTQIVLFGIRMPATDNHMYIMFFVNVGLLVSVVASILREPSWRPQDVDAITSYTAVTFAITYGAAAIAKLNGSFFDSGSSCAVAMLYDAGAFVGIQRGDLPVVVDEIMPFAVASAELLIPVLLVPRRSRLAGILLLVGFHLVISLSPTATALDFTMMLFAIVFLLLPDDASEHVRDRLIRLRSKLPAPARAWAESVAVLLLFFVLVVLVWRLGTVAENRGWMILAPAAVILGFLLVYLAFKCDPAAQRRTIQISCLAPLHYVILTLLLLNVASPYLGLKTAGTFTMYSNLNTFDRTSNHYFVPRLSAFTLHDDLVEIVGSSNEELDELRERNLRMTWHEFRRRLARDPEARISYIRHGALYEHERADENIDLITLDPVLHKLVWHRPDDSRKPRCLW